MTLADTCDVAHLMLYERVERHAHTHLQIAATFVAAGAQGIDIPDVQDMLERFDEALIADIVPMSPADRERASLLRVLGTEAGR